MDLDEERWIIVDDDGHPLPDEHFYRFDRKTLEHFAPYSDVPMSDDEIIQHYKNFPNQIMVTKNKEEILELGGTIVEKMKLGCSQVGKTPDFESDILGSSPSIPSIKEK